MSILPSDEPNDRAVFDAIRDLLMATREFDAVTIAPDDESSSAPASWVRRAHIEPVGTFDAEQDGSPLRERRTAGYLLTLQARDTDPSRAYRIIDRLEGVVRNTLLSPSNKTYGGRCLPDQTTLAVSSISTTPGSSTLTMEGRFGYVVDLAAGYSTSTLTL